MAPIKRIAGVCHAAAAHTTEARYTGRVLSIFKDNWVEEWKHINRFLSSHFSKTFYRTLFVVGLRFHSVPCRFIFWRKASGGQNNLDISASASRVQNNNISFYRIMFVFYYFLLFPHPMESFYEALKCFFNWLLMEQIITWTKPYIVNRNLLWSFLRSLDGNKQIQWAVAEWFSEVIVTVDSTNWRWVCQSELFFVWTMVITESEGQVCWPIAAGSRASVTTNYSSGY